MNKTPLLEAIDIFKHFPVKGRGFPGSKRQTLKAVEGVSFHVGKGETLALVGESGCGKTTLARTAALLHRPTSGSVKFDGKELTTLDRRELKPIRRRFQMIFQDPYSSLNPRMSAGAIIAEPLIIHKVGNRAQRREKIEELAISVGLRPDDLGRYPHQFSGGQRQRIAIARALALNPEVIIADEPVSALDVSIQSQVLNLMNDLQEERGIAYLFISHDLAVVRHFADRAAVMYLGRIVEQARTEDLFENPRHPYTRALIEAAPRVGRGKRRPGKALAGDVPSPINPPKGCPFNPRCPMAKESCRASVPALEAVSGDAEHWAACFFADKMPGRAEIDRRNSE